MGVPCSARDVGLAAVFLTLFQPVSVAETERSLRVGQSHWSDACEVYPVAGPAEETGLPPMVRQVDTRSMGYQTP